MPVYEYQCDKDGSVIELIRPMSRADDPVEDPEGKGRIYKRRHSTFSTGKPAGGGSTSLPMAGGCCPCGKNRGACGQN